MVATEEQQNNKRIAKNTLLLYFRMLITMTVSLYTSRVILQSLGVEDFGIYNVVGGVVAMFSFLNSCMASATQRFLTFELGVGNLNRLKKVFSNSLIIHAIIGIIIVALAELIGLYVVNHKLVIPGDRIYAANVVYQLTIVSFFVNVIQVPYNASIIAHEKMGVYAYISIVEVVLKLVVTFMLSLSHYDKLISYAVLLLVVQIIVRMTYQIYCRKTFIECKFHYSFDGVLFRKMIGFAGWNLFGSLAWLFRDQGVNILLNVFFGPAINAARGVSNQVAQAVMGFIANFQTALNPQITKNYAKQKILEMENLAYLGIKLSFFLLLFFALPLCLNINFILNLWLHEVPELTDVFVVLIIVDSLVGNLFGTPLMTSLAATGNIKVYQIVVSCIILLVIPISYIFLLHGFAPPIVFAVTIFISGVAGFARFLFCKKQLSYSISRYLKLVVKPVVLVLLLALPIPLVLKFRFCIESDFGTFLELSVLSVLCVLFSIYMFGITTDERKMLIQSLKKKIMRK